MKQFLKLFGLVLLLVLLTACDEGEAESFTVHLPESERGVVTADKTSVNKGESVTISVNPNQYFTLSSFKINGTETEVVAGQVVVPNVTADLYITVEFVGIDVTVNFSGANVDAITVRYGDAYGTLPSPTPQAGYEFAGWYTEENGNGSLVTASVVVTSPSAHTLYAHFTPKTYEVTLDPAGGNTTETTLSVVFGQKYGELPVATKSGQVFLHWVDENGEAVTADTLYEFSKNSTLTAKYATADVQGVQDELVRMPGEPNPSFSLEVSLSDGEDDYTDLFDITLVSSDPYLVSVNGFKLSLVEGADGEATISVYCGELLVKTFKVRAMDYDGLGYQTVSTKAEFLAMTGTGKYVLTADIDLEGTGLWKPDWTPLIPELQEESVIDGNGHIVSNAWLLDGWNNGWVKVLKGTVRNIAFVMIRSGQPLPYLAALIGKVAVGGLMENVFLDIEIQVDGGPSSEYKGAGTLVGTLEGGTVRDSLVNITLRDGLQSVSNVGALVAFAAFWGSLNDGIFNTYAVVNNNPIPAFTLEAAEGVFAYNLKSGGVVKTVHELLNTVNPGEFSENFWKFTDEGVYFGNQLVLECEPALEVKLDEFLSLKLEDGPVYLDVRVYAYGSLISDYTATFSSDNPEVLTVSEDGILTPVSEGTATVTVVVEGVEVECEVTVYSAQDNYTYIYNAEQFRQFLSTNPEGEYALANDIDLGGGWLGIEGAALAESFSGVLDGKGYKVFNGWLPGGWNNGFFKKNYGVIKNIAFVTIYGTNVVADTALIGINYGTLENVYLDFIVSSSQNHGGLGGTLVGIDDAGTIKNCIVNVRLRDGETLPSFYGSIVGKIQSWNTKIENSYSIVNGLEIVDIAYAEAAEGIIGYVKTEFNSKQYSNYASLFAEADLTSFGDVWTFTAAGIQFGQSSVLTA